MEVTGDNVCPRCHQGVMLQRKGKNGLFWGCSNYPKCRMTCNDKDGKPDMEDAKTRLARIPQPMAPGYGVDATPPPSAQDIEDLNSLFSAADYEAKLAADMQSYVSPMSKPSTWQNWADKPKYSASPMEHMKDAEKGSPAEKTGHLCPRCREGQLRQIRGKNGTFWGCTNYPRCTATFDDNKGAPLIQ